MDDEKDISNFRLERYCSGGTQGGFRTTFSSGHRHTRITIQTAGCGPTLTRHRVRTFSPPLEYLPSASRALDKRGGGGASTTMMRPPRVAQLSVSQSVGVAAPAAGSPFAGDASGMPGLVAVHPSPGMRSSSPSSFSASSSSSLSSSCRGGAGGGASAYLGASLMSANGNHNQNNMTTTHPPPSSHLLLPGGRFTPPLVFGSARYPAHGDAQGTMPNTRTGGGTLRYRTDLNQAVIHFMMERLVACDDVRKVEEITYAGRDEDKDRDWHVFWMSVNRIRHLFQNASLSENRLLDNNIINHFPNHVELTRKDLMYRNIKAYIREMNTFSNGRDRIPTGYLGVGGGSGRTSTSATSSSAYPSMNNHHFNDDPISLLAQKDPLTAFTTIPSSMDFSEATGSRGEKSFTNTTSGSHSTSSREGHNNSSSTTNTTHNGLTMGKSTLSSSGQEEGRFMPPLISDVPPFHPMCFHSAAWKARSGMGMDRRYFFLHLPVASNWQAAASFSGATASLSPYERQVRLSELYSFAESVPISYQMPNDFSGFIDEFKKNSGTTWIVKPTSRCQGKGIFLVNKLPQFLRWVKEKKEQELQSGYGSGSGGVHIHGISLGGGGAGGGSSSSSTTIGSSFSSSGGGSSATTSNHSTNSHSNSLSSYIVSKYISNPLLIGGKKFDLRLYVLVTSFKPVVAYLHECGFARFCATKYTARCTTDEDLGSHLTNVALQKGEEEYNKIHGGKWLVRQLMLYVESRYGPYKAEGMLAKIKFLIFHSLLAVKEVITNDRHCFELYGYDILIDDKLNPHLIEVNASPSLSTTTTTDRLIKEEVLADAMRIVIPPGMLTSHHLTGNGNNLEALPNGGGGAFPATPGSSMSNNNNYYYNGLSGVGGGGGCNNSTSATMTNSSSGTSHMMHNSKPWLYAEHRIRSDIGMALGTGFTLL